ncbi:MAG: hypothetical protein HY904_14890 [Deltaproteobacteria bacterium]|nr:hypothetical protein [Deltaproteobacteria bacterium]
MTPRTHPPPCRVHPAGGAAQRPVQAGAADEAPPADDDRAAELAPWLEEEVTPPEPLPDDDTAPDEEEDDEPAPPSSSPAPPRHAAATHNPATAQHRQRTHMATSRPYARTINHGQPAVQGQSPPAGCLPADVKAAHARATLAVMPFHPFLLVFSVVMLFAAAVSVARARRGFRRADRMEETPTTRLADAREGLIEVSGTVRGAEELLVSPLTDRRCVYYRFIVSERRARPAARNGRPTVESAWERLLDDRRSILCRLEDEGAVVELELQGAEVFLQGRVHAESGTFHDPPEALERLLNLRYGKSARGLLFNRSLRYSEDVITEGARLYALGHAVRQPGGALRIQKGEGMFVVSDRREADLVRRFRREGRMAAGVAVFMVVLAVVIPLLPVHPFW